MSKLSSPSFTWIHFVNILSALKKKMRVSRAEVPGQDCNIADKTIICWKIFPARFFIKILHVDCFSLLLVSETHQDRFKIEKLTLGMTSNQK